MDQLTPRQVRNLKKGGLFGEILNRVTPVSEDALFTIEEGDLALGGSRVLEARVERDEARLGTELGDIEGVLVFGADNDGKFVGVVVEGEFGCVAHVLKNGMNF